MLEYTWFMNNLEPPVRGLDELELTAGTFKDLLDPEQDAINLSTELVFPGLSDLPLDIGIINRIIKLADDWAAQVQTKYSSTSGESDADELRGMNELRGFVGQAGSLSRIDESTCVAYRQVVAWLTTQERIWINRVEPVIHEEVDKSKQNGGEITPELLSGGAVSELELANAWWFGLSEKTRGYLEEVYGQANWLKGVGYTAYRSRLTSGECFEIEQHFMNLKKESVVMVNGLLCDMEGHASIKSGLGVSDRMLAGNYGGILLPGLVYELSSVAKLRAKGMWLSHKNKSNQSIARGWWYDPSGRHILNIRVGRFLGDDWRSDMVGNTQIAVMNHVRGLMS